jgi:2-polyprenyl-6-methoxyphenol hydroxylase-like FAD-dependent oxidoreductase
MAGKAIIVGGGIAGLATARGLLGLGWDVTVYEQAASFAPVGAGIVLAPNAVRALDWLGLGEELRSKSMAHGEAAIRTRSGRWLMRADVAELERRFGVPTYALHRADLHEMLANAAAGATLRTGHRVTGVRSTAEPVVSVEGPTGPGEEAADLVVGADGLHSAIRQAMFPDHPGPAYAGYVTWRGLVPAGAAPPGSRTAGVTETWGRGERFGVGPLGNGQVYWFTGVSLPAGSHERDGLAELRERYRGWHDPIPAVLDATPPETLLKHDIHHLKAPLPRYHADRVVLVGDAAHALTPDIGQGGCLALEDAVTLTDVLAGRTEVTTALAIYDGARRPRTQRAARTSARWGTIAQWRNPVAASIRDALVGLAPPWLFLQASEGTLGWRPPRTPPWRVVQRHGEG